MSRSYRKPIIRAKMPNAARKCYKRICKRFEKQYLHAHMLDIWFNPDFDVLVPNPKTKRNDYIFSGYMVSCDMPYTRTWIAKRFDKSGLDVYLERKKAWSRK